MQQAGTPPIHSERVVPEPLLAGRGSASSLSSLSKGGTARCEETGVPRIQWIEASIRVSTEGDADVHATERRACSRSRTAAKKTPGCSG